MGMGQRIVRKAKLIASIATPKGLREAFDFVLKPAGVPFWLQIFPNNLKAGITVALVSVPLSIALAVAGGSNPASGVVTGFWAGLTASMIGGSHFNIVGPTGALSGVLEATVEEFPTGDESTSVLPLLALIAGIFALFFYALRLERLVMYIPSSVVHGFTLGVAFIIFGGQLKAAFGFTKHNMPSCLKDEDGLVDYANSPDPCIVKHEQFILNFIEVARKFAYCDVWSLIFFLVNSVLLLTLVNRVPKVPWTILFASIGIIFGVLESHKLIHPDFNLVTLKDEYQHQSLTIVGRPTVQASWLWHPKIYQQAMTVCFIGVLETLISARIADKMTGTRHDQRREVLGLGFANIVTGVLGGIPATAALARTALNVKSGATSRVSGIISAIFILIIALALFDYFTYMPMPTIACILLMVAVRMVDTHHLAHMWKWDKPMFTVSIITAVICVVADTSLGIVVGALLSLLVAADQLATGYVELSLTKDGALVATPNPARVDHLDYTPPPVADFTDLELEEVALEKHAADQDEAEVFGDTLIYRIIGPLIFINAPGHEKRLRQLLANDPTVSRIVISLEKCFRADLDGLDTVEAMLKEGEVAGRETAVVVGGHKLGLPLEAQAWAAALRPTRLFDTEADALRYAEQPHP